MLEVVSRRCSVEKVVLEMSQNLQENTCIRARLHETRSELKPV